MTHTYHAASLAELAELFEAMATSAAVFSGKPPTRAEREFKHGQVAAWRAAAAILRGTVLTANSNERVSA